MSVLFFIIPSVLIILSAWIAVKAVKKGVNKKKAVICQICSTAVIIGFSFFLAAKPVFAAETPESTGETTVASTQTTQNSSQEAASAKAMAFAIGLVAAALVTGLSGIGGGIAVAASAPAAIAATSENPKAFGKSLILVVLGEGIALYGLLISIMIFTQLSNLAL